MLLKGNMLQNYMFKKAENFHLMAKVDLYIRLNPTGSHCARPITRINTESIQGEIDGVQDDRHSNGHRYTI